MENRTLYSHPFSAGYWRAAAREMKSTRMLVVTALLVALRVALKPLAIPLGPQLNIQTAMLATALGAMVFGPVVAIPAAVISDTVGFFLFPQGDYFLPFVLTEIASTMTYALCLYRAKPTVWRVMLSRFIICFFVNIMMQTGIFAWQYVYLGNPEEAKEQILGIFTVARVFKNLCLFPIESVVLTLFLKLLVPVTRRAKLTYASNESMHFTKKQVFSLVLLTVLGAATATGYMAFRYSGTSRSADFSPEERREENRAAAQLVLERTSQWEQEQVICVVDSAYRGLFRRQGDYTVSVYVLDEAAFAAGQAADSDYTLDTLWGYSKSGPKKDPYRSLIPVATATYQQDSRTGAISGFVLTFLPD